MAKCSGHHTKFKVAYFISTKDKALTTLAKLMQDFFVPLGLRLQHLRADGGGEFITDYYRYRCKTMARIQQFSSPNTPEHNGLRERDRCTIMDVARCMLNRATLPKFLRGKIAIVATVVFLFNRPPRRPSARHVVRQDVWQTRQLVIFAGY